jgi:ribosomal protein S12 methylthiotransferase
MQVLVDSAPGLGKKGGVGRSYADAPEIDGSVNIVSRRPLRVGDIVTVKIEKAGAYDLKGVAV